MESLVLNRINFQPSVATQGLLLRLLKAATANGDRGAAAAAAAAAAAPPPLRARGAPLAARRPPPRRSRAAAAASRCADGCDSTTAHLSSYLCELTLQEYGFLKYRPSEIAAAAMCLALHTMRLPSWTPLLEQTSMYSLAELAPCVQELWQTYGKAEGANLQARARPPPRRPAAPRAPRRPLTAPSAPRSPCAGGAREVLSHALPLRLHAPTAGHAAAGRRAPGVSPSAVSRRRRRARARRGRGGGERRVRARRRRGSTPTGASESEREWRARPRERSGAGDGVAESEGERGKCGAL